MSYRELPSRRPLPVCALAATAVVAAASFGAPAQAETPAEFYAGKTFTIQVGYSPGGGYDIYARLLAQHMGKHIPGRPSIVVKNMPGAGTLKLATYMQTVAPRNGTEIATVARGIPVEDMLNGTKNNFEPAAQNWIGSMNAEASVCLVMARTGVTKLDDLRTKELSFGTQGKGSDSELFAHFVKNLFGLKGKVITGYPGTNESILAMERGEVDGNCGWSWSSALAARPHWFKPGAAVAVNIMQFAPKRHPDLKDVPLMSELARTDAERAQIALVESRQIMGRPFHAPPGVPADRVAALRKAFMDTLNDPDFKAAADKGKMEINPVSGQEVQALVERLLKTPPEIVAATRKNLGGG